MGFNHWLCMCLIQCYSHTRGPGPICGWYIYYWRRKWQPTPVFLPGESQGWSLVGCRLWGRTVRHNWRDLAAAAYFSLTCIIYLLLKFFFKIWAICKDFIEFVTILLQYIYIYIYIYIFYVLGFLAMRHVESLLTDQRSNPYLLHWKVKSWPLDHHGSLYLYNLGLGFCCSDGLYTVTMDVLIFFTRSLQLNKNDQTSNCPPAFYTLAFVSHFLSLGWFQNCARELCNSSLVRVGSS